MTTLHEGKRYFVTLPGEQEHLLTYCGSTEADVSCVVCGKEGHGTHEFCAGNPDNPNYNISIGTTCIKKIIIREETT